MNTMKLNDWTARLGEALTELFNGSESGLASPAALAYLAYTGKVENFVRDALAYKLHGGDQGMIGREHERIDLVAFDGQGQLSLAVQAKNVYIGDLIVNGSWRSEPHGLLNDLADDVHRKASRLRGEDAMSYSRLGLLLITDVPRTNGAALPIAAYKGLIARQSKSGLHIDHAALTQELRKLVPLTVDLNGVEAPLDLTDKSDFWSGKTYGCDIKIHWFLVRASTSVVGA
jgi:hypothetical protein